jgi:hypothetical protein
MAAVVSGCPLWSFSCSKSLCFVCWRWLFLIEVCRGCCTILFSMMWTMASYWWRSEKYLRLSIKLFRLLMGLYVFFFVAFAKSYNIRLSLQLGLVHKRLHWLSCLRNLSDFFLLCSFGISLCSYLLYLCFYEGKRLLGDWWQANLHKENGQAQWSQLIVTTVILTPFLRFTLYITPLSALNYSKV